MVDVKNEVLDMARGLIESRVFVKRPPSAAQCKAYHAMPKGPPMLAREKSVRPFSAKARLSTEHNTKKTTSAVPPRPPWRPFTRGSSFTKLDTTGLNAQMAEEVGWKMKEKDDEQVKRPRIYQNRNLPEGLVTLSEWLTEDIPLDWAQGYSPESSFVFLPCLQGMSEDIPYVPEEQDPGEELPYTPLPQVQKYKPPKSRLKKATSQEICYGSEKQGYMPNVSIYRGKRTKEIIRQEIQDLERLLQGIGNPDGSSIVVRYQHDINHLQNMVKSTLEGYTFHDIERCTTPIAATLQEDLVKYPEKHDEIMASICKRRDECIEELALIERRIIHGKS